jgi:hypothetical protein
VGRVWGIYEWEGFGVLLLHFMMWHSKSANKSAIDPAPQDVIKTTSDHVQERAGLCRCATDG